MKTLYKVLPIMLSVGLFGCSNSNNTSAQENTTASTPVTTENKDEFVSKLPDSAPVVKVASDSDFAPYEFKDEFGKITGFDIQLMQHIGEDQGFKVEHYTDRWEDIFNNLDLKNRDMLAAAIPYSAERDSKYLLSNPYAPLPSTLLYVNHELDIKSLDDLDNIKIGVLGDTVQHEYFSSGKFKVESVEPYLTTFAAVQGMVQGEVDAVAEDSAALRHMMKDLPDLQPKYFDYEDIHADSAYKVLVVDKDQPELLEKVNAGLENLIDDGTYAMLTTRWFGEDLTKDVLEQKKPQS